MPIYELISTILFYLFYVSTSFLFVWLVWLSVKRTQKTGLEKKLIVILFIIIGFIAYITLTLFSIRDDVEYPPAEQLVNKTI